MKNIFDFTSFVFKAQRILHQNLNSRFSKFCKKQIYLNLYIFKAFYLLVGNKTYRESNLELDPDQKLITDPDPNLQIIRPDSESTTMSRRVSLDFRGETRHPRFLTNNYPLTRDVINMKNRYPHTYS